MAYDWDIISIKRLTTIKLGSISLKRNLILFLIAELAILRRYLM